MHTTRTSDDIAALPLPCTVCLLQQGIIGPGTIWAFYPERCHVASTLSVSPGMTVSLSLQLASGARVKLEPGLITWAGNSEFGIRFIHGPASMHEEMTSL